MRFINYLAIFQTLRLTDVIDILLVAFIVYRIFMLIRETRAEQLTKGIIIILIFARLSDLLDLYTINWLLSNALTVGVLVVLIVFQPELRRGLEYIGRSKGFFKTLVDIRGEHSDHNSDEVVSAVASLARQKIGAIIVLEGDTGLSDIVDTGVTMNAVVSSELLINIFIPNTPLHDGAVIIRDDKIRAAGCFLPLTDNASLSKQLGTRHRAALGMSERSDALVVVVSEETGAVSIASNGKLERHVDTETLKEKLYAFYLSEAPAIFKSKGGDKQDA